MNRHVHQPFTRWTQSTPSGTSPSYDSGPSAASEGNFYLYAESSFPNFASVCMCMYVSVCVRVYVCVCMCACVFVCACVRVRARARVCPDAHWCACVSIHPFSPLYGIQNFDLQKTFHAGQELYGVAFQYHMYGTDMGTVVLESSTDGANFTTLWSASGNRGDQWLHATVYAGSGQTMLRYTYTSGAGEAGDFALDDIRVGDCLLVGCAGGEKKKDPAQTPGLLSNMGPTWPPCRRALMSWMLQQPLWFSQGLSHDSGCI